jgi:uncharacterized phage protein (TIGR01671 family)
MRQIKFRAWDHLTKQFIETGFHVIGEVTMFGCIEDFIFENKGDRESSLERFNDVEVTQFTGLKDKNGKDIYEADVMKIQLPMGGFWGNIKASKVGEVFYEPDYGGFIVKWEYSKNQHHERLTCDIACEAEILGNIYENKELLNLNK